MNAIVPLCHFAAAIQHEIWPVYLCISFYSLYLFPIAIVQLILLKHPAAKKYSNDGHIVPRGPSRAVNLNIFGRII